MALITVDDLKAILEVPGDVDDSSLESFIADAHIIVSEDLAGKGLSDARLATIEKYVAAHLSLLLTERGGLISSRAGTSQDNYLALSPMGNSNIGGLQLTRYGQQAIALDSSGTLLRLSKQSLPAQFRVISELDPAANPNQIITDDGT